MEKDFKKSLNYVFLLLRYRARSEHEIRQRLLKRNVSAGIINKVISYLQEYQLIDDEAFARSFVIACQQKGWGPRKIAYVLKQFGVTKPLQEIVFADQAQYQQTLRELIEKKKGHYKKKKTPYQQMLRFLLGRGFFYTDIVQALEATSMKGK